MLPALTIVPSVLLLLPASAKAPLQQRKYAQADALYHENDQEAGESGHDIAELHISCTRESLTDLYGEGDPHEHGEDIEERDDDGHSPAAEPQEDRVQDQHHRSAQQTNDDKVQLLVCIVISSDIVDIHQPGMDAGDEHDQ